MNKPVITANRKFFAGLGMLAVIIILVVVLVISGVSGKSKRVSSHKSTLSAQQVFAGVKLPSYLMATTKPTQISGPASTLYYYSYQTSKDSATTSTAIQQALKNSNFTISNYADKATIEAIHNQNPAAPATTDIDYQFNGQNSKLHTFILVVIHATGIVNITVQQEK